MNNSKVIQILKTLTQKEWTDFEKFAASPYFNKGRNFLPLVKILKKFYPDFSGTKLSKQYVYARLYKGRKYNDNTMKHALSGLLLIAKEFLIQTELSRDLFERKIILLKEFSSRRINSMFESDFKHAETESGIEIKKQIKLEDLRYNYFLLNSLVKDYSKCVIEFNNLKTIDFMISLLQSPIIFHTIEEQFNISSPGNLTELFLKKLNAEEFIEESNGLENKFKDELIFNYFMYKSEADPSNTDNFVKARDIYNKIFGILSHHDKFNYFRFLEAYLIRHRRKGNIDADWSEAQQYELSKNVFEKNIYSFSPGEYMSPNTFENIFFMSLSQKDYEFTDGLLNRHLIKIQPDLRTNVRNSLSAFYSFQKKEYNEAKEFLSRVKHLERDFCPIYYKLSLRKLKLMIFFELRFYENLFSEIDSYRHYLKGSLDSSEEYKAPYLLFVNDVEKILKASLNNSSGDAIEIMNRLMKSGKSNDFYNRWLLSKTRDLLKA